MNTLLFRLSGPMQSWGVQSRFSVRETGLEPSKSGVLGLVCAALGAPREDDDTLRSLAALHMGVRVEREGVLSIDYHTAGKGGYLRADGSIERKNLIPSRRYYLADAVFLVGFEVDNLALLERLQAALERPVWPLFLGRKAFVPGEPVFLEDGLRAGQALEDALGSYPCLNRRQLPERLRLVLEDPSGAVVRPDQPISFVERRFAPRRVSVTFVPAPPPIPEVM